MSQSKILAKDRFRLRPQDMIIDYLGATVPLTYILSLSGARKGQRG